MIQEAVNVRTGNVRTGNSVADIEQSILDHLRFTQGKSIELATSHDWYMAVAFTVRDRMMSKWVSSLERLSDKDLKIVGYLSAEFLMGPHLGNALLNLDITAQVKAATESL